MISYSNLVKDEIAEVLGGFPEKIDTSKPWQDIGCDSLDFVEILMNTEIRLQIAIKDEVAGKFKTPNDLISYLDTNVRK